MALSCPFFGGLSSYRNNWPCLGTVICKSHNFLILGFNFLKIYPVRFNWGILKESLKLSYPLTPKIFLGVIGNQFDKYMIGLLATVGGVGIYSIGQKVAGVVFTFMGAIQNVYSPQVYKRMFNLGQKGGESVGRYMTPFAYISIAVALLISLFSEEVISLLTPEPYHGAIDIVIVLSMFYGSWFFGKQPQLIYVKKDTYQFSAFSRNYCFECADKYSLHHEMGGNWCGMGNTFSRIDLWSYCVCSITALL